MEEFNLDMNNILSDEEYAAIVNDSGKEDEKQPEETEEISTEETGEENIEETEENTDGETQETVGVEEEQENHPSDEEVTSPNTYSSIASAFKEDGVSIFSDVTDDELKDLNSAEAFENLISSKIDAEVDSRLNEVQRRINESLKLGVDPDEIKVFESSLANLKAITDEQLEDESDEGLNIRKSLIYTDLINRGFSKERAAKEVQKSINASTDIEDAKDALQSNIDFYQSKYDERRKEARKIVEDAEKARAKQAEDLRKSILEDSKAFGVEVDKKTRQKMYDFIAKPVGKDRDGNPVTELMKYEAENHNDFMKYVAYAYIMTDGFKSLEKLEKTVERKATKKSISALEKALKSSIPDKSGDFEFVSGVSENKPFAGGWTIDTKY